jgi:hypothetical protein
MSEDAVEIGFSKARLDALSDLLVLQNLDLVPPIRVSLLFKSG